MCRDYDGKVTPEEVAAAALYLKDTLGKEGIQELISNLSKDKGKLYKIESCLLKVSHHSFLVAFGWFVKLNFTCSMRKASAFGGAFL